MNGESTLYGYLYQAIAAEIEAGRYRFGAPLPSQEALCRQYNVGITTVRRTLKMLEADGFIATAPRKRATVLYQADERSYAAAVLQYKTAVLARFQSFEPVLAPLQALGAARLSNLDALKALVDSFKTELEPERFFERVSLFFTELLAPYRNRLLIDLQVDVSRHAHVPYPPCFAAQSTGRLSPEQAGEAFTALLDALCAKDYPGVARMLRALYLGFMAWTERFFDALEQRYPDLSVTPLPAEPCEKAHHPLYTAVARRLFRRIQAGEFDGRRYIPSLPELMSEYDISQATALSAVALLSDIGVVRMHRKRGTSLAPPGSPNAPLRLSRESILEHLILFLSALQILACSAGCLSERIMSGLCEAERKEAAARLQSCSARGSAPIIRTLLELFREHAPHDCLARYLTELDDLLIWGYYLSRAKPDAWADAGRLAAERFAPLPGTLVRGEIAAFSEGVRELFVLIYRTAHDKLVAFGADPDRLPAPLDAAGCLT